MKLRHFVLFGGIFTVIICLLLFLFIVTADDEESSTSHFDFSGLNLSEEVLKHQPTVEKYAKEYGISDYVNYLLAIMQVESGGTAEDVMQVVRINGIAAQFPFHRGIHQTGVQILLGTVKIRRSKRLRHRHGGTSL